MNLSPLVLVQQGPEISAFQSRVIKDINAGISRLTGRGTYNGSVVRSDRIRGMEASEFTESEFFTHV